MANDQAPMIRVLGFKTTYETRPVRGTDPLNETLDAKGFRLDAKGQRILANQAVDWVTYAPAASPLTTQNVERIGALKPTGAEEGDRALFMQARWAQIEPAYDAWKQGQDIPVNGIPLAAWPGLNSGQVEVLRSYGLRTVEEVRDLTDSQRERVKLPNMRELSQHARLFIENRDAAAAAQREADKDDQIAAMQARIDELSAAIAPKPKPKEPSPEVDDEIASLRAELDAKGVDYDKRWAAPKLRAALVEAEQVDA